MFVIACPSGKAIVRPTTHAPRHPPSTPEDRQRARAIVHAMEIKPLNPTAEEQGDRAWLVRWLSEVPDVNVVACTELLGPIQEAIDYAYGQTLLAQALFGQMVFVIDHRDA